jgi:LysR family glycine cleavage system transcriptional activator
MRRTIPSTMALLTFESAARHQSFTKAADELSVTQSAVCRQIAGLEGFLGLKLFRRIKRGVALTEAGRDYGRRVAATLDELERDAVDLMARVGQGGSLELGVVPTFATKWLLPRLKAFQSAHPGITVNLTPQTRPFLFDESPLDAAIYAGESTWPGTERHFLMRESLIAVCSPELLDGRPQLSGEALMQVALLQQSTRPGAWRKWFGALGLRRERDHVGARFELFSMLTEAAIHGMGLALIPRLLIEDELRRGLLVKAVEHPEFSDRSYYLITPVHKSEGEVLRTFQSWLEVEAERYRDLGAPG